MRKLSAVAAAVIFMASLSFADDYSTWTYQRYIVINTRSAPLTGPVTNFPLLIRLSAADVFAKCQKKGQDIRFAKSSGAHLPYQIEQWDSANAAASIWVLVDTIKPNDSTPYLKVFYGKSAAVDSSNGPKVFDTANGFQGVWHFADATDATINAYNLNSPSMPTSTPGIIGSAYSFDGSTNFLRTDSLTTVHGKLDFPLGGPFTLSAWAYVMTPGQEMIVGKADKQYSLNTSSGTFPWQVNEYDAGSWYYCNAPMAPDVGTWYHVVGVVDSTGGYAPYAESLYVNGILQNSSASTSASGTAARDVTHPLSIGKMGESLTRFWSGNLDEIEVSSRARTGDWVALSFLSQKQGSTVTTLIGSTAVLPSKTVRSAGREGLSAYPNPFARSLNISYSFLPSISVNSIRVSAIDISGRTVWEKSITGLGRMTTGSFAWNGNGRNSQPVTPGVYLMRMTAFDEARNAVGVYEQKVSYQP